MRKVTVLIVFIIFSLLAFSVFEVNDVKATLWNAQLSDTPMANESINVTQSFYQTVTYVNYSVNINGYATGGTPPYTYQWYMSLIPQELFDSPFYPNTMLDEFRYRVKIQDATSPTLNFTQSTLGVYSLRFEVFDVEGNQGTGGSWAVVLPSLPAPPNIEITSLENVTYGSGNVSLNFTASQTLSTASPTMRTYSMYSNVIQWIGYSLDGKANGTVSEAEPLVGLTVNENLTLSGLRSGLHSITVYAKDTFGNVGASEPVSFLVVNENEPAQSDEPIRNEDPVQNGFLSILLAAALLLTSIACAAGIIVYIKRRNH